MSRVALVGLPKQDAKKIETYFQSVGVVCEALPTLDALIDRLPADPPALIVTEKPDNLDSLRGLRAVLKTSAPATPFVVTFGSVSTTQALEIMSTGAYDCLSRPFSLLDVLASAKRATASQGRTLFGAKVKPVERPWKTIIAGVCAFMIVAGIAKFRREASPAPVVNLGSATLSGIYFEGRSLWVGNWVDATVTHYQIRKSLREKGRSLTTDEIFHAQDSQPILIANTPEALVSIGNDLKIRSHQRVVGLPSMLIAPVPANNPTGLTWDGSNIWSSDGQTGLIYKHGPDLRVIDTVKSILPEPAALAWDGKSLWVAAGSPLKLARLNRIGNSWVWQGPYMPKNLLPDGVPPSGMAVAFGRVWVVTGGVPHMMSQSISEIVKALSGWRK